MSALEQLKNSAIMRSAKIACLQYIGTLYSTLVGKHIVAEYQGLGEVSDFYFGVLAEMEPNPAVVFEYSLLLWYQ